MKNSKTGFIANKPVCSQVMRVFDNFRGVNSNVQILKNAFLFLALVSVAGFATACGESPTGTTPGLTETAATVNGKNITFEEVERAVKQQAQGQDGRMSQLELAGARLQILQSLIEQEVMFQKAEKEGTLPTEEEVTAEFNKRRTASGFSEEQWKAKMAEVGETDASLRLVIKKGLAIAKLNEKITGKVEQPKDAEVEQFYNGNKEGFKRKRGAQLAAIVIDPRDLGEGDTTKNELEAQTKAKEVGNRVLQPGTDFATVAREMSEDPETRMRGGDWRYFTEEEMKQAFPQGFAEAVMSRPNGQVIPTLIPFEGRYLIIKTQTKIETDEDRTLDSPGVRQEITEYLINARKQLLSASYQTQAMNEARIDNFLAKRVVENPNELSGARPAAPANANTNAAPATNTNTAPAANTSANATPANKPAAANTNAAPAAKPAANANAGK